MDRIDQEEAALSTPTPRTEEIKARQKEEIEEEIEIPPIHSQPNKIRSEPCPRTTEVITEQCAPLTKDRTKNNDKDEMEANPGAQTALEKLIDTYGEAADILKEAIWPTLNGKQELGEVIDLFQNKVAILYPEGVQKLGVVAEVVTQLSQTNAIASGSILLGRKVQECDGKKVLLLAKPLSEAITAVLNELSHSEDVAVAKKTYQYPHQNKRFGNQKEQRPSSVLSKPATESMRCTPESEKEYVEDMTFISQMTHEKAIQMLKTMIQEHQGRWLVTPVMQQDGYLITSDHALNRIIEAYPELGNQYQLRSRILLDRHKPLLRTQAGQLRLKIKE